MITCWKFYHQKFCDFKEFIGLKIRLFQMKFLPVSHTCTLYISVQFVFITQSYNVSQILRSQIFTLHIRENLWLKLCFKTVRLRDANRCTFNLVNNTHVGKWFDLTVLTVYSLCCRFFYRSIKSIKLLKIVQKL